MNSSNTKHNILAISGVICDMHFITFISPDIWELTVLPLYNAGHYVLDNEIYASSDHMLPSCSSPSPEPSMGLGIEQAVTSIDSAIGVQLLCIHI